jgi:hypothetical protein
LNNATDIRRKVLTLDIVDQSNDKVARMICQSNMASDESQVLPIPAATGSQQLGPPWPDFETQPSTVVVNENTHTYNAAADPLVVLATSLTAMVHSMVQQVEEQNKKRSENSLPVEQEGLEDESAPSDVLDSTQVSTPVEITVDAAQTV